MHAEDGVERRAGSDGDLSELGGGGRARRGVGPENGAVVEARCIRKPAGTVSIVVVGRGNQMPSGRISMDIVLHPEMRRARAKGVGPELVGCIPAVEGDADHAETGLEIRNVHVRGVWILRRGGMW